jgi:CubicO group peptidase (beta-lactamase class C family)
MIDRHASDLDPELSELAEATARDLGVVGAQVSVLKGDELRCGVAGVLNAATGEPVRPDSLFQIGSTTKLFTAMLVMQLVDEGRIGLDTPVVEQLPGFSLADPDALNTVTPRHLMSMSSGIDNGPYSDFGRGDGNLRRYVSALADIPMLFHPGTGYGYSNASTNVSGALVAHVTRQTWEAALETRILEPAGLRESANLPEDVIWRSFARGHTTGPSGVEPIRRWALPRSMGPAGGLVSSAADLARFAHAFLHEGRALNGERLLSGSAAATMHEKERLVPPTLLADWWGLGPYGKIWDGVEVTGHSGTQTSGSSYLLWARERGVAIATTVNVPDLGYPFAAAIFRALFPSEAGIKVPPPPTPPDEVEVDADRLVGRYAMWGVVVTVDKTESGLTVSTSTQLPDEEDVPPGLLIPLTPTSFLPTDRRIDGGRGWAMCFVGDENEPAALLLNGFFAHRRIA